MMDRSALFDSVETSWPAASEGKWENTAIFELPSIVLRASEWVLAGIHVRDWCQSTALLVFCCYLSSSSIEELFVAEQSSRRRIAADSVAPLRECGSVVS